MKAIIIVVIIISLDFLFWGEFCDGEKNEYGNGGERPNTEQERRRYTEPGVAELSVTALHHSATSIHQKSYLNARDLF